MAREVFVVKYNEGTDLYMIQYNSQYSLCQWGNITNPQVMEWSTLAAAQAVAASINSGTVGTTKPN